MDKWQARESRSPKNGICDSSVASIVGGSLMKVTISKQMTSWRFIMILEDDVMAVYKISVKVMKEGFFSSVED